MQAWGTSEGSQLKKASDAGTGRHQGPRVGSARHAQGTAGVARAGRSSDGYSRPGQTPEANRDRPQRYPDHSQGTGMPRPLSFERRNLKTHVLFKENKFYFYNQNILIKIL